MGRVERWIDQVLRDTGSFVVGEIRVLRKAADCHQLIHRFAHESEIARRSSEPEFARVLARTTGEGKYRPLKSAPNLARDWMLELATSAAVALALDHFYPAALGLWLASRDGRVTSVPFTQTAGRQTGMYRIVGKASREVVDAVSAQTCQSAGGCLRTILWEIEPGKTLSNHAPTKFDTQIDQLTGGTRGSCDVPILCLEACNLLVAACRAAIKKERSAEQPSL